MKGRIDKIIVIVINEFLGWIKFVEMMMSRQHRSPRYVLRTFQRMFYVLKTFAGHRQDLDIDAMFEWRLNIFSKWIVCTSFTSYTRVTIIFLAKFVKFAFFFITLMQTFHGCFVQETSNGDWKVNVMLAIEHLAYIWRWTLIAFLTYPHLTRRIFLVSRTSTCEHRNLANLSNPSTRILGITSMSDRR